MSDWPFVAMRDDENGWCAGHRWDLFKAWEGFTGPETLFIREDAARAWQALRDWLDGSVEQWQERSLNSYMKGYDEGYEDRTTNLRG